MAEERITNKQLHKLLINIAAAQQLKDESRFVINAYLKAADAIEKSQQEMYDLWKNGQLKSAEGVGPSIKQHLEEYFSTGKAKRFDEYLEGIPETVFMLTDVPGIGPKKAFKLVQSFELINPQTVFEDLKKVAQENKIATLPTFGAKSQQDILESLEHHAKTEKQERMPLPYAYASAQDIIAYLEKHPKVEKAEALGSMRRRLPTIGDIDIAVIAPKDAMDDVIAYFLKYPNALYTDTAGENKAAIIISPNIRVDLRVQQENNWGSMLQYFTGSKAHNIKLREFALAKNLSLSEWGIKKVVDGKIDDAQLQEFRTEEEFYAHLGLDYIPPEIREGSNEIDLAKTHKVPELVTVQDIKGDLHTHALYEYQSSHDIGADPYDTMGEYALKLGYEYIGFSDHNPSQQLSEQQTIEVMKKRKHDIDEIMKNKKIAYFIGLEVDILPDGNIALPEKAIEYVDYLIVSVHSAFRQTKEETTQRLLKALSFPKVKIYGHPTGRRLGKREGIDADWEQIFAYVAEKDIAMEINSATERLDLPDYLVREALKHKIKFTIDTDAHAKEAMDYAFYGVSVARRGWCTKYDILNTRNVREFREWILKP
jgi:DNA polymerase (family 10)